MSGSTVILVGLSCVGITALVLIFRVHATSQQRYLRRVESAFGLKKKHRVLLEKMAVAAQLPDRSSLLLVPSLFEMALEKLDPDFDELSKVEELRQQILSRQQSHQLTST